MTFYETLAAAGNNPAADGYTVLLALIAILGPTLTALGAGLAWYFNYRNKCRADALAEYARIVQLYQEQMARQDVSIKEGQAAIAHLAEMHAECRQDAAEASADAEMRFHLQQGTILALRDALVRANIPCPAFQDLPPPRVSRHHEEIRDKAEDDLAHEVRTVQQNAALVQEVGKKLEVKLPVVGAKDETPGGR